MAPLASHYDTIFFDLDGVVYRGPHGIEHAADSINAVIAAGTRCIFVTNNASRPPSDVAAHLRELGIDARDDDVVTSSQAGARLVHDYAHMGAAVLAVGGPGVSIALAEEGFLPVTSLDADPRAILQGFGQEVGWSQLAEATYAINAGIPWVATNLDSTFPTARGLALGNGSMVAGLAHATGRRPVAVAGKPEPGLLREAMRRTGCVRGLMVGDRLDTDIAGAHRIGMDSLMVLTGVNSEADAQAAPTDQVPTYLAADLRALLEEPVRWSRGN